MHVFFNFFGLRIPAYGLFITIGVLVANIVVYFMIRRENKNFDEIILLEAYCFIGAVVGAKALFLITAANLIDWHRVFTDLQYFDMLYRDGFVFYGGLIGAVCAILLCGKIHKTDTLCFMRNHFYSLPLGHAFGRIGCFLAGCCYGREYHGPFAVLYPEGGAAPHDVERFPVQLLESLILFTIFGVLFFLKLRFSFDHQIELYLILYGTARFLLEYLRSDGIRGILAGLSTSQWISVFMLITAVVLIILRRKKTAEEKP